MAETDREKYSRSQRMSRDSQGSLDGSPDDDSSNTKWQIREDSIYLDSDTPLYGVPDDYASSFSPAIKTGWLDKTPPQGSMIYQKRWVRLDQNYLRYFQNEKEIYSKRMIPLTAIKNVIKVGGQKFEVVTKKRKFLFRAQNKLERNEWISLLEKSIQWQPSGEEIPSHPSSSSADMLGYLELHDLHTKLYVVVCTDKVFLYKNAEDYQQGIGITFIEMKLGSVKDTDKKAFDLKTPYRIFSFVADSEPMKEVWVKVLQNSISEALSCDGVAQMIWSEASNRFCADCGAEQPEWAAVNLSVVLCRCCAGEHRRLGSCVSKVRSLKMDKNVWNDDLIQVFLFLGNDRANLFWAANVPPSEAVSPTSSDEERRSFIFAKYRLGKYRCYNKHFGHQEALNNALCVNVQTADLLETLSLVFCGANVNCDTGDPDFPTPISLARSHKQRLQAEFLSQNQNCELPGLEADDHANGTFSMDLPSTEHCGYLFKMASTTRPVTEGKAIEDFSLRWCSLKGGSLRHYNNDEAATPVGEIKMGEIVCLAVDPPGKHGCKHTFEVYSESERISLFGADNQSIAKEWTKFIVKSFVPHTASDLVDLDFERIGRMSYKLGLNLESTKVGWFALVSSTLYVRFQEGDGAWDLCRLQELSIQEETGALVLVEKGRTLFIERERKLDFQSWCTAIQRAAGRSGDTLSQQQLTDAGIPVIVDRCVDYVTRCGLTSDGIYRKSGVNSRVTALLESFQQDARGTHLREHHVDNVASVLKRFLRDVEDGVFSDQGHLWLATADIEDKNQKIAQYQWLLSCLPLVNRNTLRAVICHLHCIQHFASVNQMNQHNLAIIFGPTLFQTDGALLTPSRIIEELTQHYVTVFDVDEKQVQKQLEEMTLIAKVREASSSEQRPPVPSSIICTVFLEEAGQKTEQHIKVLSNMTAAQLVFEVLDHNKISPLEKDYWSCFEINQTLETERALHYQEEVLPVLQILGVDNYLVVKKQSSMEAMLVYLASKPEMSKCGRMKFREDRNRLTGRFQDRYFTATGSTLRLYKDISSNWPDREWPVKSLKISQGIVKRLKPPSSWGMTIVSEIAGQEQRPWYLCCDGEIEMEEWLAVFLSIQHEGNVWPKKSQKME